MSDKCWCESAKEDIDKAYTNPNPYYGRLQDIMDAEIDYAKMCAICPCRKRPLEVVEEEPAKKRKEVESEEPEPHEEESDEDAKSEVSLVIAEFDSEEEPDEADPREVEEE